ncbi:helix-turn-helix domain-containing protein [Streptomyces sp. NPDC059637]
MPHRQAPAGRMSTVLGRKLGGELHRLRDTSGLSQPQAAAALTATQTKIAKIERGVSPVREPDLHTLCDLYGVARNSPLRNRFLALAHADRQRRRASGWWKEYSTLGDLVEYIQLEDGASTIRTYQNHLVPGLLQTAQYARAVASADDVWQDADEVEHFVQARLARQARLTRENPLHLHAVVCEAALRQQVGGRTTMRFQLQRLVEASAMPNVTLQVLPFSAGAHASMTGPFVIVGFDEPTSLDVVYVETAGTTLWLESEEDAERHRGLFDNVCRSALSPDESRTLISDLSEEM